MTRGPSGILYCLDHFSSSGGTENQLAGLLERLDRKQFEPHVCVLRTERGVREVCNAGFLPLSVHRMASAKTLLAARKFRRYLVEHRIDIVQTFFQDATIFAQPLAWSSRVPVRLISFRDMGFWRKRSIEIQMRWCYRLATGFLANSVAVKQAVVERDGLPASDVRVIHNGLDPDLMPYRNSATDVPTVAFLGNLNRTVKRPDLFVEAAGIVRRVRPDVRWVLIGDGRLRGALEQRAMELDLGGCMTFLGRRQDVSSLLQAVDIGVNCSDSEGFANAILEFMLAGATVVATDVGGNSELIRHGEDGLLVPPGQATALAQALLALLADPERAERLRGQARRRVEAEFHWDRCVADHESYYADQIAMRSHS